MYKLQTKALTKPHFGQSFILFLSLGLLAACSSVNVPRTCTQFCIEAERGSLFGAFVKVPSQEASGGSFVRSLENNEADLADHMQVPDPANRFSLAFDAKPGLYTVKVWVTGKDLASDSFYVKLNDEPYFVYSFNNTTANKQYPEFVEDTLREASIDPKVFQLSDRNTLTFFMREAGAALDKLELIPLTD